MKPRIITSMLATMWLLLATSPLHAWQDDAKSANETKPNSGRPFQLDSNLLRAPTDATDLDSRIKHLKRGLESLDSEIRSRADNADPTAVRNIVERIFDTRQHLQRLEAQRMRLKLQLIESNLDAREQSRDTIIDQRLKKFLHRQDQVETTQDAASSPNDSATSTPIGLPGPPAFTGDAGNKSPQILRNSGASIQWPQPSEIIKELRQHRDYATAFLRHQNFLQSRIERFSSSLEELKTKAILDSNASEKDRLEELESLRDEVMTHQQGNRHTLQDSKRAWSTYQSRLRLLKLDVEEAKLALKRVEQDFSDSLRMSEERKNAYQNGELVPYEIHSAKINLKRAEELLKLYADIETQHPDLNPDSFDLESIKTEK